MQIEDDAAVISPELQKQIATAIQDYIEKKYPSGTRVLIKDARADITQYASDIVEGFVGPTNVPQILVNFYDDGTVDVVFSDWPEKGLLN